MSEEKPVRQVGVKIVKADNSGETPTVFVESQKPIEKSDKSEQLSMVNAVNASEWITHPIDMRGLKELVDNSTILPQCIRAYKSNIAALELAVGYRRGLRGRNHRDAGGMECDGESHRPAQYGLHVEGSLRECDSG